MALSRKLIRKLLSDEIAEKSAPTVTETESSSGPGFLNLYHYIHFDPGFLQTLLDPVCDSQRKVIICDPLIRNRPLNEVELKIFEGLVKHYQTYFWPGSNVDLLSSDRMLLSLDQFNIKKSELVPDTKQTVIKGLAAQSLSKDDFIILDREGMAAVMNRFKEANVYMHPGGWEMKEYRPTQSDHVFLESQKTSHQLNLSWHEDIIKIDEICKHIDCNKITFITVSIIYPEDARKILRLFKNLETINILMPVNHVIETCLPLFSKKNVMLWLQTREFSDVILPPNCRIKNLTLIAERRLVFNAEEGAQVANLTFIQGIEYDSDDFSESLEKDSSFKIDVSQLPALQSIEVQLTRGKGEKLEITTSDRNKIKLVHKFHNSGREKERIVIGPHSHIECIQYDVEDYDHHSSDDMTTVVDNFREWVGSEAARVSRIHLIPALKVEEERLFNSDYPGRHWAYSTSVTKDPSKKYITRSVRKIEYVKKPDVSIAKDGWFVGGYWRSSLELWQGLPGWLNHENIKKDTIKFIKLISIYDCSTIHFEDYPQLQFIIITSDYSPAIDIHITLKNCPNLHTFICIVPHSQIRLDLENCSKLKVVQVTARHVKHNLEETEKHVFENLHPEWKQLELKKDKSEEEKSKKTSYYNKGSSRNNNSVSCYLLKTFIAVCTPPLLILAYLNYDKIIASLSHIGAGFPGFGMGGGGTVGAGHGISSGAVGGAGGAAGTAHGIMTGVGTFILAHPIMLAIAGSLTLCALAYLLYKYKYKSATMAPTSLPLDNRTRLTKSKKNKQSKEDFRITVYDGKSKRNRPAQDCRAAVFTDCRVGDKISLETKKGNETRIQKKPTVFKLQEATGKYKELQDNINDDEELVSFEGKFKTNVWHVLPSGQAVARKKYFREVHCNVSSVEFLWDDRTQQCKFRYKSWFSSSQDFILFYKIKKHPVLVETNVYSPTQDDVFVKINTTNPSCMDAVSQAIKDKLQNDRRWNDDGYLKSHPALEWLKIFLDDTRSDTDRIRYLFAFCTDFDYNRDLANAPSEDGSVDTLIEIIMQQAGVCRHASTAFMFLCQLYGFACHVAYTVNDPDNPDSAHHVYPELLFLDGQGNTYSKRVDFSLGYNPESVLVQNHALPDIVEKKLTIDPKKPVDPEEHIKKLNAQAAARKMAYEKAKENTAYEYYYKTLKDTVALKELNSLDQMLTIKADDSKKEEKNRPTLLLLQPGQTPFGLNTAVIRKLKKHNESLSVEAKINIEEDHLFINDPSDFARLLAPGKIENGKRVKEKDGPLRKLLANNSKRPKLLFINGKKFNATQMAAYQTMMDRDNPFVSIKEEKSIPIPDNVKIIWILDKGAGVDEAFGSRVQCFTVADSFFEKDAPAQSDKKSEDTVPPVNVFDSSAYEEFVFGPLNLNGREMEYIEGPLMNAIKKKCPLVIYNPPKTDRFKLFLHQINEEKKILWLNGEIISIPNEVVIVTEHQDFDKTLPSNVDLRCEDIESDEKKVDVREKIFLGVHNLHECYTRVSVNEKTHEAKTIEGLLSKYDSDKHVFYITMDIPLSYWRRLMDAISKDPKQRQFNFILAPNASIHTILSNPQRTVLAPQENKITTYTSNDPGYLTEMIAARSEKPYIIDVNHFKTFNELVGEIKQTDDGFYVKTGLILEKLKEGYTVILNGEVSFGFYQQLLSLLSENPYIDFNGQKINFPGKLIAVMPSIVNNKMQLMPHEEKTFNFEHYREAFKDRENDFDKIKLFYEKARLLPHRGPGRPDKPFMSFKRIKTMLFALETSVHQHNPIKSVFNADYPADSADYAYLNVMGKMIFRSEDTTDVRSNKLLEIIERHSIHSLDKIKEYSWQILNCFNGADINVILGADFLEGNNRFPSLSAKALNNLEQRLKSLSPKEEKKQPRHSKQMEELNYYLKVKKAPIIILQGPAGVGKSHAVRKLLGKDSAGNDNFYEGEEGLIKWLKSKGEKPFLADEMNMTNDWDFLEVLGRSDKTIIYKGEKYTLSDQHQVIGTCNPVGPKYPGRTYVNVIQDLAVTIAFKTPSDSFYINEILLPKLLKHGFEDNTTLIIEAIMHAYYLIQKHNPHVIRSIRDIENVTERFICLAKKNQTSDEPVSLQEVVTKACLGEFSGSIQGAIKRQQFINEFLNLAPTLKVSKEECQLIQLTPEISITDPKEYFVDAVMQDLEMRWQALLNKALAEHQLQADAIAAGAEVKSGVIVPYYKQSITVEGEAGVGKSVCLRAIVDKHIADLTQRRDKLAAMEDSTRTPQMNVELKLLEKELQKKIYKISGGSSDPTGELTEAFHGECIIIVDECNLNPMVDRLMSQFVCGVDEQSNSVSRPGFMFIGSQNSTEYGGRHTTSKSKQNRDHMIYLDGYTDKELIAFAENIKLRYPRAYVRAYNKIKEEYPHANMRTFHEVSKDISRKEQELVDQYQGLPSVQTGIFKKNFGLRPSQAELTRLEGLKANKTGTKINARTLRLATH